MFIVDRLLVSGRELCTNSRLGQAYLWDVLLSEPCLLCLANKFLHANTTACTVTFYAGNRHKFIEAYRRNIGAALCLPSLDIILKILMAFTYSANHCTHCPFGNCYNSYLEVYFTTHNIFSSHITHEH